MLPSCHGDPDTLQRPDLGLGQTGGMSMASPAHDMLGHVVGITEDWISGRLEHYGSTDWTSEQVRRHAGDDQLELFGAWSTALDQLDNAAPHPAMGGRMALVVR